MAYLHCLPKSDLTLGKKPNQQKSKNTHTQTKTLNKTKQEKPQHIQKRTTFKCMMLTFSVLIFLQVYCWYFSSSEQITPLAGTSTLSNK